jgi:hypothetical protein
MRSNRILITFLVFVQFMFFIGAHSQDNRARNKAKTWKYEIEVAGIGTQGTSLVKVWNYSKNQQDAIGQAKMNAVHGVIFRGFAGKSGIQAQPPLARDPNLEKMKDEFFKAFFSEGGQYLKYATISNDGSIEAGDRLKVGKEYKIAVVVSVNVSALRKDLENAGIISRLGAGF